MSTPLSRPECLWPYCPCPHQCTESCFVFQPEPRTCKQCGCTFESPKKFHEEFCGQDCRIQYRQANACYQCGERRYVYSDGVSAAICSDCGMRLLREIRDKMKVMKEG